MAMSNLLSLLSNPQFSQSSGDIAQKGNGASEATDGCPSLPSAAPPTLASARQPEFGILPGEVVYLQSQNGNLNDPEGEFASLRGDVPSEIPWASEALDKPPEAVNL
ncbi:hypothetical protein FS837_001419 [Tulasnella sp. UAMH 9824]|nr:hypothetical protein FS837_001419 [Tulasnella sp. UAMH 9824]